jgi:ketosteroid isomerase-like protein
VEQSRYVLHDGVTGERTTVSLVQIFRTRDGKIAMLRDYFRPA